MFVIRHESTTVAVCGQNAESRQIVPQTVCCSRTLAARCMAGYDCLAMTNDIIEKLRKHLAGGVRTECRVVIYWPRSAKPWKTKNPTRDPWRYGCFAIGHSTSTSRTLLHHVPFPAPN